MMKACSPGKALSWSLTIAGRRELLPLQTPPAFQSHLRREKLTVMGDQGFKKIDGDAIVREKYNGVRARGT
jgi:hypothetical protein